MNKMKKRTEKAAEKTERKFEKMEIINFHAEGMDAGSRSRCVATGQKKEDGREFGVYTSDLHRLCRYLTEKGVTAVAPECTGCCLQPPVRHAAEV
jgi:hypothetical protein